MSDQVVTIKDLIPLTEIVKATQRNGLMIRAYRTRPSTRTAEIRSFCDENGNFALSDANVLDLCVRITYTDGMRETGLWSVQDLIRDIQDGYACPIEGDN